MEYEFTTGAPITEHDALEQVAAMGMHGLAFDDDHEVDEVLHWHEFTAVTWVISGTGSFADEHGHITQTQPGCRVQAPAGWLHRTLAGTQTRLVIGTDLPGEVWTGPINKDPADLPAAHRDLRGADAGIPNDELGPGHLGAEHHGGCAWVPKRTGQLSTDCSEVPR